jgi:predicted nuclease of restriction endonuclease-like (RecB) superfamily
LVISSVITKIMEWPLLKELKKVKLNKAQIGFQERLGTELNIVRLRETIHNLQNLNYNRRILQNEEEVYLIHRLQASL